LHNEELRRLYSSTDVISVIKWRLVRCLWRTSGLGDRITAKLCNSLET